MKVYEVTYTKRNGQEGSVLIKGSDTKNAIANAKNSIFTGNDFRNPQETDKEYIKPRMQGFAGRY